MKVLIVCSFNSGKISPFVEEQVDGLVRLGIRVDYYKVRGKGAWGYLKNLRRLKQIIKKGGYDLIHAHYGLSGLLSVLQKLIPVITTYHGSDVNKPSNNFLSSMVGKLSSENIYVSKKLYDKLYLEPINYSIIPCGINLNEMISMPREEARQELGMTPKKNYILFSSSFDRPVKNSALAKEAVNDIENTKLVELSGYSRRQVVLLMNACDLLLMTSFTEGSPQVVKEAMACNLAVISTDVGDVKEIIKDVEGCYIVGYDVKEIIEKIKLILNKTRKTKGRDVIQKFDNCAISREIKRIYERIIKETHP